MKKLAVLPALALGFLLFSCASTAQQGALARAHEDFAAGSYREALSHAIRAASYQANSSSTKAEALFLEARCHEALKETAAAIALYQVILKDYAGTEFASRSKIRLADLQR